MLACISLLNLLPDLHSFALIYEVFGVAAPALIEREGEPFEAAASSQ